MYLRYGNYQHADNEVSIDSIQSRADEAGGVIQSYVVTWQLSGRLQAADQASLTTAINALQAAYSQHGYTAALYDNNGALTPHVLTGARVIQPPSFPVGNGAEFSTYRTYTISLESRVDAPSAGTTEWIEAVSVIGTGGPLWVFAPVIEGLVQKSPLREKTPVIVTQTGPASGRSGYPIVPAPLFPQWEHEEQRSIQRGTPKREGGGQGSNPRFLQYPVSWEYRFELPESPGTIYPTAWPY